ncbi:TIGR00375 family protein [Alkalicella caledoniensis]|uniref:TIGR00375 family protein n=1 Tax=Alkalicella caledoniensis TaxID=2731377 RepID=A0A7G9WBX8_ALKCA|nr:endonuclease Q family protein [Alkalicella caledoniensis]QNO16190.1 TIGR00375 family protein [Alkalicella caledoniensis]
MKIYNCDLHIHVGRALSKPVKVTASRNLTISNIIKECTNFKGIEMAGIVDCASPAVLSELTLLVSEGTLLELPQAQGGLRYRDRLTIILGSEVETSEGVHVVCYFPDLTEMIAFSEFLAKRVTNSQLSTQRAKVTSIELLDFVKEHNGIFMPAHIFTPHKSYYGKAFERLEQCFGKRLKEVKVVELGLSSDSKLADCIQELHGFTFLTNSDAHSQGKIAREFNKISMKDNNYEELRKALYRIEGRQVIANYGLEPELGKYYNTFCSKCDKLQENEMSGKCSYCGSAKIIKGVSNRIKEIADLEEGKHPAHRPQYHYQVPLEFIPNIGKKTLERLHKEFGFEVDILHTVEEEKLKKCLDFNIVDTIIKGREGSLKLKRGGGGRYGKIINNKTI